MTHQKKILVVDDSASIRNLIRNELEEGGYDVVEAENGVKALLQVANNNPPDLITLDMDMPVLNGFGTCKKLQEERYSKFFTKQKGQRVPIIFITANDNLSDRRGGFELGAADFITKPFAKGDILAAVDKILNPETHLKRSTALVVDDSNAARGIVTRVLESEGVTVIEAQNGVKAYEILCNQMADIDLLITDLMMPEMNGEELCRKVRQELNLQDLPIIFLTAISEQSALLNLFKSGGTDYIVKPFVKEELLARLNVHLERTELNKRLRDSVNELRMLNKMKDNLLSVCSHDLRTPLNAILGFAELMLEKEGLSEEDKQSITDIKVSGELLLELINDLLDLSKIQSEDAVLELSPIFIYECIKTSFHAMKHMALKKNQHIELTNNCPNAAINGNVPAMIRVLNNLLSNAIKFTPENGKIGLKLDPGPAGHLTIHVSDTGIGIPPDTLPHLFDKFTKTSQSGTSGEVGTGLGMSIVKEIVNKHNGTIEVASQEGKGTTFSLSLPITLETPDRNRKSVHRPGSVKTQSTRVRSLKILLADDNKMNVKVAHRMLKRHGHSVTIVTDGAQAVDAVDDTFDIVLMDIQMPDVDGLEATRRIRDSGLKTLPIIALTADTAQENKSACIDAGMNDFLSKPFKSEDINTTLLKWCR